MPTVLLIAVPYVAAVLFLGGLAWRVWTWAATPEPFRIPTTTGQQRSLAGIAPSRVESPSTTAGVVGRMLLEGLSLIHISEPTRLGMISYAVFCLKKKK